MSRATAFVAFILSDVFLGFLAIVAVGLSLAPALFRLPIPVQSGFEAAQWAIISLFGLEYAVGFSRAEQKKRFLLDPWRLIDAATVLIPLATLLPGASEALRSSPVLRLIRVLRVASLGIRAGGILVKQDRARVTTRSSGPAQVQLIATDSSSATRAVTWPEFLAWARDPGTECYSVVNATTSDITAIASAIGISQDLIQSHLLGASYPHLESSGKYVFLFLWVPQLAAQGTSVNRSRLLVLANKKGVITLSPSPALLGEVSQLRSPGALNALPFSSRILCSFLSTVLERHQLLVDRFEQDLRDLEDLPVRESRQAFFERTFRLKKDIAATQADLWRLKGLLEVAAESGLGLPGAGPGLEFLRTLAEKAEYLYETATNLREGLLSVIELHLNVVSFEMNRVMRLLAVVSVLGLIPAVIGGLFGMNLSDNPWPLTLPQVTFIVCGAMTICFYFFFVKGWLR